MNLIVESDASEALSKQIDALLRLMDYDPTEVLYTDLSRFTDFYDQFTYPKLEDVQRELNRVVDGAGLAIQLDAGGTLVDAARAILAAYPKWPQPKDVH